MRRVPRITTCREVFPQFMIELVARDVSRGPFNLLFWDGTQAHIQPSMPVKAGPDGKFEPRIFEAPHVDSTIFQAIHFPIGAAPYESGPKLFADLCALIQKYTTLPERLIHLAAHREPELQQQIVSLLKERNEEVQTERATDLNSIVVEAMLSFSHEEKSQSVRVGELTTAVNAILEQRGELLELKPRTIGNRLGALGLATKRLDAAGRGLLLLDATRRRIHKLARDYGVALSVQGCSDCERLPEAGEEDPQPITGPGERQPGFIENKQDQAL